MVNNTAFNGRKALNPFNFKHYNMSSADILINGKTALAKPLTMNIATNEYLQAYWNTMSALGYNSRMMDATFQEMNLIMDTFYCVLICPLHFAGVNI